jgi:Fic family protein
LVIPIQAAIGGIQSAIDHKTFKLRPSLVLSLQREALRGISAYDGNFRPAAVEIEDSKHTRSARIWSPSWSRTCATMSRSAGRPQRRFISRRIYVALNRIHPFSDGNGRTSRMVS